jgi:MYXO-CTERM domain-containing protein
MRKLVVTLAITLSGLSATAHAHFILMSPLPTNPADSLPGTNGNPNGSDQASGKGSPPCGPDTMMAATPTPLQGGHSFILKLEETTRHGGFYRVALAITSRSEIPLDNVVYDANNKVLPPSGNPAGSSDHADTESPSVFPVLGDNLFMHPQDGPSNVIYQMDITLPNVSCDRCILQVIEFMHPHGPNPGGGYFYHHCAELKLTADPAMPLFVPGADGGTPDAAPIKDASNDATGGGGANSIGSGGAGGSGSTTPSGAAGANGTAGSGGSAATAGAAGITGSAGMVGGMSGAAGAIAGSGGPRSTGGGGCSVSSGYVPTPSLVVLLGVFIILCRRRRRS